MSIGDPVGENRYGGKYFLKRVESITAWVVKLWRYSNIPSGKIGQRNNDVWIIENKYLQNLRRTRYP